MSHVWNRRYIIWWIIWWWIYDDDKFDWAIVFSLLSDSSDSSDYLKVLKIFHSYCSKLFPFFREASIHCLKQFFFFFHFETSWSFISGKSSIFCLLFLFIVCHIDHDYAITNRISKVSFSLKCCKIIRSFVFLVNQFCSVIFFSFSLIFSS